MSITKGTTRPAAPAQAPQQRRREQLSLASRQALYGNLSAIDAADRHGERVRINAEVVNEALLPQELSQAIQGQCFDPACMAAQ